MDKSRFMAYALGASIQKQRMAKTAPLDAEALSRVEASDVIVVPGGYDHVELVLEALEVPFQVIAADQLSKLKLRSTQLVVVNCPGVGLDRAVPKLREFVADGGSLFTTDWALRHVIERAFPGVVAYNDRPTRDEVVRIEIHDRKNSFLNGVMDGADDPQWWLEGSSYPIRILAPERVEILLSSAELKDRYGEAPVAVLFKHGQGEVFHMISHYYLQRTDLRENRHKLNGLSYAAEKGVSLGAEANAELSTLKLGDVESAASSARLMANILAAKKRRPQGK
jgi:hypothetical protein